jgi:hypothetical protein
MLRQVTSVGVRGKSKEGKGRKEKGKRMIMRKENKNAVSERKGETLKKIVK